MAGSYEQPEEVEIAGVDDQEGESIGVDDQVEFTGVGNNLPGQVARYNLQ